MVTSQKKYGDLTDSDYKHKSDTVDGKKIYFKTATSENTPQDFINLDSNQICFINSCLADAKSLIKTHFPNNNAETTTTTTLDDLIDEWNNDSTQFTCDRAYFINAVGVAFGEHLVKTYKMKWKLVVDEYGPDYATTIDELKFSNFPINSVLKAIVEKREGSLTTISLLTKRQIENLKKENL